MSIDLSDGDSALAEQVRNNFTRAASEFGFAFTSPYCLDERSGLFAFVRLVHGESEKQAVVLLSFPPHFDFDRRAAAFCSERDIFFSVINAKIYGGEYDCALFAELMEDWK